MKIVYAYVVADILHEGHLLFLENAKALGDKLIVGVLTDEAVMEKKPRPTIPFKERLKIISALKCVDCAIPQNEYAPINNLKAIQPDIHIESTDHIGNKYMKDLKKVFGGRIVMFPYYVQICSTSIKDRIKNNHRIKEE